MVVCIFFKEDFTAKQKYPSVPCDSQSPSFCPLEFQKLITSNKLLLIHSFLKLAQRKFRLLNTFTQCICHVNIRAYLYLGLKHGNQN